MMHGIRYKIKRFHLNCGWVFFRFFFGRVFRLPTLTLTLKEGGGVFNESVGEEFQVVKREKEYNGRGEEYNMKKRGK